MNNWLNLQAHRLALTEWWLQDGQALIQAVKLLLALGLAIFVSMFLQLPHAYSAALTVVVVMQRQAGQVFARSTARVIGTFIGAAAMLCLVGLFHQQPVMFMLGTSLCCALLITGAVHYRDTRSYMFILSAITVALIGVPAGLDPSSASMSAINRALAVVVGIFSSTLVTSILFPVTTTPLMSRMLSFRLATLSQQTSQLISGRMDRATHDQAATALAADMINFESLRQAASSEQPEVSRQRSRLIRLNHEFLELGTRIQSVSHALHNLRGDISADALALQPAVEALLPPLIQFFDEVAEAKPSAQDVDHHLRECELIIASLKGNIRRQRKQLHVKLPVLGHNPRSTQTRFESIAELLVRMLESFRIYLERYRELVLPPAQQEPVAEAETTLHAHVNGIYALTTGLRSVLVILLAYLFWHATGWSGGTMALQNAMIVAIFTSTSPNPGAHAIPLVKGSVIGYTAGFVITHFLLPNVAGFWLMMLCLAPFFAVGAILTTNPKRMAIGLGMMVNFCFVAIPDNPAVYDAQHFTNQALAGFIGFAGGALIVSILFPPSGRWLSRLLIRDLRKLVRVAVQAPLEELHARIAGQGRDILNQTYNMNAQHAVVQRELLDWHFNVQRVSQAIIELRTSCRKFTRDNPRHPVLRYHQDVTDTLDLIARLHDHPRAETYQQALNALDHTLDLLTHYAEPLDASFGDSPLRQQISYLHFIRIALTDRDGPFAAFQTESGQIPSGVSYAA